MQLIGVELAIVVADLDTNLFIGRFRGTNRIAEIDDIVFEAIERNIYARLALIVVAEIAHAQRRTERLVISVVIERRQTQIRSVGERFAQCGRRAEQIQYQPAEPSEIAYQAQVMIGTKIIFSARVTADLLILWPKCVG